MTSAGVIASELGGSNMSTELHVKLISVLRRFVTDDIGPTQLWSEVEELHKAGVAKGLTPEREHAFRHFVWYLDLYDPSRPPRPGVIGRVRDVVEEELGHEPKVGKKQLHDEAVKLLRVLEAGAVGNQEAQ